MKNEDQKTFSLRSNPPQNLSYENMNSEETDSIINKTPILIEKVKKVQFIQDKIRNKINELKILNLNNHNTAQNSPNLFDSKLCNIESTSPVIIRKNNTSVQEYENSSNACKLQPNEKNTIESIDSRIITKKKTKKGLLFIREGVFIKRERELNDHNTNTKKNKVAEELFYSNDLSFFSRDFIPELESWDLPFVRRKEKIEEEEFPFEILESEINDLIEHPVPIEPYHDPNQKIMPTIFLTPKERAKLRRIRRREKETKKQDRIRMGLEPPPEPKMKLSNLINVYNNENLLNPSKIEMQIRRQIEERVKAHEERNRSRQLSKEERSEKNANKWKLDPSSPIIYAAIFNINRLFNRRYIFKIDRNAHDCHLTGCCVINSVGKSVVFVEGSKKSIKFYKNLLLNRIKWNESVEEMITCNLIWEGTQFSRKFRKWKLYYCHSNEDAYQFFSDNNSLDLWNMSKS